MVIQRMRDGSDGILAKVIIGLIIIVFALFGFGSITTFLAPSAKVATVNGDDITQQAMELAVERNRRLLLARGANPVDIDEDQLRETVLRSLISRQILTQAAEDLDLYYGDVAIDREIVSSEVFQVDGVFNTDQFQNIIRSAGYTPLGYRDELRNDKLVEQMVTAIRQSSFVTGSESLRYASLFGQTRDIAYIRIPVTALIDEVTVTDEEIEGYYAENAGDFVTDETVDLAYVELSHDDMAEAYEVDEAELQSFYERNLAAYSTDETRRLAHILIETGVDVSPEEALAEAEQVVDLIKQGEDFAALAEEYSDDPGSRINGGDLGVNPQGTFLPEFEAVAYDLDLNQVSPPVQTEFGYHIIKVLDINKGKVPTLAEIRPEIEAAYRLDATEVEFVSRSSRLAELLFEHFESLEVPAEELGLEIKTTGHLSRDSSSELMSNSKVAAAAYSVEVLVDGNNSDLIELSDSRRIGLRVRAHNPSETLPLADVREDIRYILQRQQAADLAEARASDIVDAIRSGSLAQYAADTYGYEWEAVRSAGRFAPEVNPQVLEEAFKLPRPAAAKESLGWTALPGGDTVVLRVSRVTNRPEEKMPEQDLAQIRTGYANQLGAVDFQEFEDSLTIDADVDRN